MQSNYLKIQHVDKRIHTLKQNIIKLQMTNKHCDIKKYQDFDVIQDKKDPNCEKYLQEKYSIMLKIDKLNKLKIDLSK